MSITIAADMHLLCSLFKINYQKIANEYQGMTVDEIMKAEAAQGNTAAAGYSAEVLNNPSKLIELFKLADTGNKYAILHNMSEYDLDEMIPLLQKEDLVEGLNFFTKDKLLKMFEELPKEQLVNVTGQMFSQEQIMQYLPEDQINKMLMSTDMDKEQEKKYLMSVRPEVLAFMLESVTGKPVAGAQDGNLGAQMDMGSKAGAEGQTNTAASVGLDGQSNVNGQAVYNQLINLPDDKFQEAMLAMPKQNKRAFVLKLAKENPKLYLAVDAYAYTNMIGQRKDKDDMVKAAKVVDNEHLIKMVAKLPKELLAVVLTQIDTKKFADKLQANFKDILKQIVAA